MFASRNGQIDAPRTSPYQTWETAYQDEATPTSDVHNDSGPDERTFSQQVCTATSLHLLKLKVDGKTIWIIQDCDFGYLFRSLKK